MKELVQYRRRDAKVVEHDDGTHELIIGRHLHYVDANDDWHDVDLEIKPDPTTGQYTVTGSQVVLETTMTGLRMTEICSGASIEWLYGTRPLKATANYLFFGMAGLGWRIYPTPTGAKVEATVTHRIGPSQLTIPYRVMGSAPLRVEGNVLVSGNVFHIPAPFAIGADGERYDIAQWGLTVVEGQPAIVVDFDDTDIPANAFPYIFDPTTTFAIDDAVDDISITRRTPYTSTALTSMSNYSRSNPTGLYMGRQYTSFYYYVSYAAMRWDTSILPENAVITDASLSVYVAEKVGSATGAQYDIRGEWYTGAYDTASIFNGTIADSAFNETFNNFSIGLKTIPLNNANENINRSGITMLRLGQNIGTNTNSTDAEVGFASSEDTTYQEPRLHITYTLPVNLLSDSFRNGSIDGSLWSVNNASYNTGGGARLSLNTDTGVSSIQTLETYSIENGSLFFTPVFTNMTQQTNTVFSFSGVFGSAANHFFFGLQNNTITAIAVIDDVSTYSEQVVFNAAQHKFWRVRETSGTFYHELSADGLTWNVLLSYPTPPAFLTNSARFTFALQNVAAVAAPAGYVVIDTVNVPSFVVADTSSVASTQTYIDTAFINMNLQHTRSDTDAVASSEARSLLALSQKASTDTDQLSVTETATRDMLVYGTTQSDTDNIASNEVSTLAILASDIDSILGVDVLSTALPELTLPTIDDVITGRTGTLAYTFGMRYYNIDMVLLSDISNYVSDVTIDWDQTRSIKRTIRFNYIPTLFELEHTYFVEPYVTIEIPSPYLARPIQQEMSLGYYSDLHHALKISDTGGTITYTGHDLMTRLISKTVNTVMTVPAGSGYNTIIRNLCVEAGFADPDVILPMTVQSTPTSMTWEPGTTYYDIVNKLCSALNWESPYIGYDNKLYVVEMEDYNVSQPDVIYATDNDSIILPDVQHNHESYGVVNQIIISVDDPLRAPFSKTYINNSVHNPYSYTNTGKLITEVYEDLDFLASTQIAETRAKLIAQRETPPHTLQLTTWLDFRRRFYEVYHIFIDVAGNEHGHISSRWRCTAWSMTLQNGGTMSHTLQEILEV